MPLPTHPRRPAALAIGLLTALAVWPAAAVDCNINPLQAHDVAKLRGWSFRCDTPAAHVGVIAGFVTYPPSAIGCTFKTPPVLAGVSHLGHGQLFRHDSVPGTRPDLKNGWRVKHIEISGGQWHDGTGAIALSDKARVIFRTGEQPKASRTYNFQLNKLVLTHPTGSCAKVLDEAF